jgi:hypothetical protein
MFHIPGTPMARAQAELHSVGMSNHELPNHTAAYAAASQQWIHAEQMRWTILNNFLVGNTILLVAWSTLFVALVEGVHAVGLNIVLIGFCGVGMAGSVVWAFLELRANRFADKYFEAGLALEQGPGPVPQEPNVRGPFWIAHQHRSDGLLKTHKVVVGVPIVFAAIYVALLIVSIYAAAGRL